MQALVYGPIYPQARIISTPCVRSGTIASTIGVFMTEVLVDSDILIDHLRGYDPARQYLKRFEAGEGKGYLSVITVAELATGQMRQRERQTRFISCSHSLLTLKVSGLTLPKTGRQANRWPSHTTAIRLASVARRGLTWRS